MGEVDPWESVRVEADEDRPGRWTATIDPVWVAALVPLGGLTAAVAAKAMTAELHRQHPGGLEQPLRSAHFVFVSPVPAGPVEADVTVLRAGRTMSQAQVTLRAPDADAGLTALAAFGTPRQGYRFTDSRPPTVPHPDDCPSFRDPPPPDAEWDEVRQRARLWDEVFEGRAAMGLPPWDRSPRTGAESATWYRFDQPPPLHGDRWDEAVPLVLGDLMLGAVNHRIGFTTTPWFCPSVDLTVHLFGAPRPGWILGHSHARVSTEGYVSLENEIWGPGPSGDPHDLELVAYCSQQSFYAFPDGPPPPDQLDL